MAPRFPEGPGGPWGSPKGIPLGAPPWDPQNASRTTPDGSCEASIKLSVLDFGTRFRLVTKALGIKCAERKSAHLIPSEPKIA